MCNYVQSADVSENALTMTIFKLTRKRSFGYYEMSLKDRFRLERTENEYFRLILLIDSETQF